MAEEKVERASSYNAIPPSLESQLTPTQITQSLKDLASRQALNFLKAGAPELPISIQKAAKESNQQMETLIMDIFTRLSAAEPHIQKPNRRHNVVLTPLEASTLVHLLQAQFRSDDAVKNRSEMQTSLLDTQNKIVSGLRDLFEVYEKKLSEALWVATSKSFSIYGKIFADPERIKLDVALLQSQCEMESHKNQLLQSRLAFANIINDAAMNLLHSLTPSGTAIPKAAQSSPLGDTSLFNLAGFLKVREEAASRYEQTTRSYRTSQATHRHLKSKQDWEFVELLWESLRTHIGATSAADLLLSHFIPMATIPASLKKALESGTADTILSMLKSTTAPELRQEMNVVPVRYAEGLKNLLLISAFEGNLTISSSQLRVQPAVSDSTTQSLKEKSTHILDIQKEQMKLLKGWKQSDQYLLHVGACKSSNWINKLYDLLFGKGNDRTEFQRDEIEAQILDKIVLWSKSFEAAQKSNGDLRKEQRDMKGSTRDGKPVIDPALANLEKEHYEKLNEKFKAAQLEVEREKSEGQKAATTSRLQVERTKKSSDLKIQNLKLELASAHKDNREMNQELTTEINKHLVTQQALVKAESKVSMYQEHYKELGPKYKEMKTSHEADQTELQFLRSTAQAERDRCDAAVRQATLENGRRIAELEGEILNTNAKNARLESNARALSAWKDEVAAMTQVQESMVVKLDTAREELAVSEQKRVTAEAEVSRMKELATRLFREMTGTLP
ncbi:hypothetical protein VTL71DRAFT_7552 [Oculimacula yallundae]|uniref:Uncharacterized protein n=1 Tax=Oculimacula yallundae TaxID=86028 RepID=A0ABR4BW43_9HELO